MGEEVWSLQGPAVGALTKSQDFSTLRRRGVGPGLSFSKNQLGSTHRSAFVAGFKWISHADFLFVSPGIQDDEEEICERTMISQRICEK